MDLASVEASKLIAKFTPLIHKTMHRLNISRDHMLYDDYFQELQIKLIHMYRSFDGDPLINETDSFKFTAYAGKGLYWRGIDIIRNKKLTSYELIENENLELLMQENHTHTNLVESNSILEDFFRQAKSRLSEQEYLLFRYLSEGDYSIQEIAKIFNVSRATIYKRREMIQRKLEDLKECLMN